MDSDGLTRCVPKSGWQHRYELLVIHISRECGLMALEMGQIRIHERQVLSLLLSRNLDHYTAIPGPVKSSGALHHKLDDLSQRNLNTIFRTMYFCAPDS